MQKNIVKKGLVIAVILLFVAVSFQPVFADYNKMSTNNSTLIYENENPNKTFVNMIIKVYSFNQIKSYNLKLSNQQLEELNNIFDNLKIDLYKCKSEIEVIELYKDTIVSLKEKCLLPKGLSVKEVQDLVINKNYKLNIRNFFNQSLIQIEKDDLINKRCLIVGKTTRTQTSVWYEYEGWITWVNFILLLLLRKIRIYATLAFGDFSEYEPDRGPAIGWIYTIGLRGIKIRNTPFYGQLGKIGDGHVGEWIFKGAYGFTGLIFEPIQFINDRTNSFYFGYARIINIG